MSRKIDQNTAERREHAEVEISGESTHILTAAKSEFSTFAYRRSRVAYTWECAFEYFVSLLMGGAFLANILTHIGMSDSMAGIVASFISLAFLFQLFSLFVVQRIRNTKRFVIIFHFLSQMLFMSLYLIPLMPFAQEFRHALVFLCVILAYFGNYFVTSIIFKWGNSYVDPRKRARFSAGKEMISLASGMVMTLVVGQIMDYFAVSNNPKGGFIFCAAAILIFSLSDLVCLLLIKNELKTKEELRAAKVPMKEVIHNTLGNRNFRSILIFTVIWNMAVYTVTGYLGTYYIKELAFTVGAVQLITNAACGARFLASRPFGRFSDRRSYAKGLELGLVIAAAGFLANIFTVPGDVMRYFIVVYAVLYNVSMAGISGNSINIVYSYVDERYFVQASAIKNSVGGLCGFGASLAAGALLDYIQGNGNMLFGLHVYPQQVLSTISFALTLVCIAYCHFVIGRQKVMLQ